MSSKIYPMKILHVISEVDPRGGGPIEGVCQIGQQLISLGHQVEVVSADNSVQKNSTEGGICFHACGPTKFGKYSYSRELKSWLGKNHSRFDAIIVNGLWQYHGFALWQVLRNKKIPYFVFTHGMLDPWFKHTYPLKHLKKWLYWPWAEYRVLRDAAAVVFTCEEERMLARESFWLYRVNETVTAYGTKSPPTDGDGRLVRAFYAAHPELQQKRLLLYLSRIHEKKGCDLLIHAFARVATADANLHLVMAGPDQTGWVASLKHQAELLGVAERISWPGMLQDDKKWGAFHAAEVFCLPSHQENFGIVVAEALACGKPVLISNKVNIWREIEQDGAGIVNDDTLEGTVDGLNTWLNYSGEEKEKMRTAARSCFEGRFRIEQVADSLIRIISEHIGVPSDSSAAAHMESMRHGTP